MSSINDLDGVLAGICDKLTCAEEHVGVALDAWDEVAEAYQTALDGTNDPDALDLLASHSITAGDITKVWRIVRSAAKRVADYRQSLEVTTGELHAAAQPPDQPPRQLPPKAARAIATTAKRLAEHEVKLARYREDPYAYDDGRLRNAPNEHIRNKMYQGRIDHLEAEIRAFKLNIQKHQNGEL